MVAVPSRLYFQPSRETPLDGPRVAVKDDYKLSGVVQTMGSRSYTRLYGTQTETANTVRTLIDLGAVIVGKTKLGAYAGSELLPEKCVDYFPPWNPRGDGHQGPSGSSSEAGSTVATYDWVGIGIGTDSHYSAIYRFQKQLPLTTSNRRHGKHQDVSRLLRALGPPQHMVLVQNGWHCGECPVRIPFQKPFWNFVVLMTRSQFDTVGLLARSPEPIVKVVECCTNLAKQQPLVSVTSRF